MNKKHNKTNASEYNFYMKVFSYISEEYKPKYSRIYADSTMSDKIAELVNKYYSDGNTVPFVSAQIVDLIKSAYRC